jgi:hypothetical protein
MKKLAFISLLLLSVIARADDAQEADLSARIRAIESARDMALLDTIFKGEDMPIKDCMALSHQFQLMIAQGIGSISYVDIYPVILEDIKRGITVEGQLYEPNVKPYKMIQIEYKDGIKNGSAGFSIVVGDRDGKLWVTGYRKTKK